MADAVSSPRRAGALAGAEEEEEEDLEVDLAELPSIMALTDLRSLDHLEVRPGGRPRRRLCDSCVLVAGQDPHQPVSAG